MVSQRRLQRYNALAQHHVCCVRAGHLRVATHLDVGVFCAILRHSQLTIRDLQLHPIRCRVLAIARWLHQQRDSDKVVLVLQGSGWRRHPSQPSSDFRRSLALDGYPGCIFSRKHRHLLRADCIS